MIDAEASRHAIGSVGASEPHDVWYENTLVAFLAVSAGLLFVDRLGIVYVFPQIQHELGLNHAQLGLLMGATSLTWAISSIIISFLSDALGGRAKLIIVLCVVGFSCATGLIAITTSFAGLLAIRAVAGMFFGPAIPLMMSVAAKSSSRHRLGTNVGIVGAGMVLLGNALSPALVGLLASKFGWHMAFFVLALPGLLLAAVLAVIIRPDQPAKRRVPAGDHGNLWNSAELLVNRNLILALIGGLALISFLITFPSFAPLFLSQDHTISTTMRTVLLTLVGLSAGFGNFFVPMLSDRYSRRTCALVATCCTTLVPVAFILMRAHHLTFPLVLVLQFIAGGAMPMVVFVIPGESVPRRVATTAFALPLSLGELIGGSTTPGLAGLLSDHYGLTSVMWFCCGLGAVGMVAVLAMLEPPRRADAAAELALEELPPDDLVEGVAI